MLMKARLSQSESICHLILLDFSFIAMNKYDKIMAWAKEYDAWAREYDTNSQGDNSCFSGAVHIKHRDGSEFKFCHAFVHRFDPATIVVFSEHNGYHVFFVGDLESFK